MKLYNKLQPYFLVILAVVISTFILWLPFLLKLNNLSFEYIYRNYDGLLYIIPAKTFYDFSKSTLEFIQSLPTNVIYFAAHLPLYPLLIRVFKEVGVVGGYLKSMLFVNLFFTTLLSLFFYYLLKQFKITTKPLLLVLVFLFLPRFLVVRSVGAPESIFILLILSSLYFFEKEKYLWAAILGGLSVMTKVPGILLFAVYFLVFIEKYYLTRKFNIRWLFIFLIPLGLVLVFALYWLRYGDFFAFFHSDGLVPMPYPFAVFNASTKWVGTAWLEDILFYFFMYGLTAITLKDFKYRSFFYFSLIFLTATIFVQHRDIARYSLPLWPLACIAFAQFFTSKKFFIIFVILLPAIYFYAWNFLQYNVMPMGNWAPYL